MEAPRFCVPLRLYRLVSPAHDRRLCLFQKLQTQSPESATLATGRGEKGHTHRERRGEEKGRKTGEGEQQRRWSQSCKQPD